MGAEGSSSFHGRPAKEIFTIGHGKRSWESFLELLGLHRIGKVVDVRAYPASRKSPHFSRERLEVGLAEAGIVYRWEGRALGGFREPMEGSRNMALRNPGMRGYADHMAAEEFLRAVQRLEEDALLVSTAVMCAEVDPFHCHRGLLADYLTARGVTVRHIKSKADPWTHRMSPLARLEGEMLVYDRGPLMLPLHKGTGSPLKNMEGEQHTQERRDEP